MDVAMTEKDYFQEALSNFACEVAWGGAVRHLTDLGYTVRQVMEHLDFPVSYDRVRRAVWDRLLETGVILREEPGKAKQKEKVSYVREYDRFGKASFRRVVQQAEGGGEKTEILYRGEVHVGAEEGARLAALLQERLSGGVADRAYMSCDFGLTAYKRPEDFNRLLQCLDGRQREYMEGLPWELQVVYHRLDSRMRKILVSLCNAGLYHGVCYFPDMGEKILVGYI